MTEIPESLARAGRSAFADFSIHVVNSTPSTQDLVRKAVLDGSTEGVCCVALEQTQGRGRQGRTWFGAPGQSLLVSLAVAPPIGASHALPFVAGLAIHDTAAAFGVAADIKWPNDILVEGRKLAGTLVEGVGATGMASVGMGINIDVASLPPGISGAGLAQEANRRICWQEVLECLLPRMRARLDEAAGEGFVSTLTAWTERSSSIGANITAINNGTTVVGTAVAVDDDGALLVRTDKGVIRLLAADVHIGSEP